MTFYILFPVASLLSCLHQLKIENSRLEDHINGLVSRRDHLLAVNARLAIPLGQQTATTQGEYLSSFIKASNSSKFMVSATHLSNGPSETVLAQPTQQLHQQAPPASTSNKRPAQSNPPGPIQPTAIENGQDYHRAHHSINSNQIPSSQAPPVSQSSNIRFL